MVIVIRMIINKSSRRPEVRSVADCSDSRLARARLLLGFRVYGLGFRVEGLGFWVQGLGFRV